jgi:ankyrin repeat protein
MPIFTRGFSGKDRQSNWTPDALAEDTYFEEPTQVKDQRAMTGGKFEKLDLPLQTSYAQAAQAAAYASEENLALLQRLLPRIKINAQEPHRGETLLIVASVAGNAAAAELLLEHKADVNLANRAGFTPLMAASRFGSSACVRVLCLHNADVRLETPDGRTALDLALAAKEEASGALEDATAEHHKRLGAHHRPDMVVSLLEQMEDAKFEEEEEEQLKEIEAQAKTEVRLAKRKKDEALSPTRRE